MSGTLHNLLFDNAMLDEGVRARRKFMRSGASRSATIAVALLCSFFYIWIVALMAHYKEDMAAGVLILELVLVTLIMPASAYGAIAVERERSTWDALILTRLTPGQIVAGKILWRIMLLACIILLSIIPTIAGRNSVAHVTDSMPSMSAIVRGQIMVFGWGMLLTSYGLWVSSRAKRSVTAAAMVIGTVLAALILLPVLFALLELRVDDPTGAHGILNPIAWFFVQFNPFAALTQLLTPISQERAQWEESSNWIAAQSGTIQAVIYGVTSVLLWVFTLGNLTRLDEPAKAVAAGRRNQR